MSRFTLEDTFDSVRLDSACWPVMCIGKDLVEKLTAVRVIGQAGVASLTP